MFLNCHSRFSFRYGVLKVEELLQMAEQHGQKAIVLTDINSTSACLNFIRMAQESALKAVVGIDFRNGADQQFVALAKTNKGFQKLNQYLSSFLHQKTPIPERPKQMGGTYIIYPFRKYNHQFIKLRQNEFIGIHLEDLKQFPFSPWREHEDKFVLLQTVSFRNKRDFNVHRLLRAIENNCLLAKLKEKSDARPYHRMNHGEELEKALHEFPLIKQNTLWLLQSCNVSFTYKHPSRSNVVNHNKQTFSKDRTSDRELLRDLCRKGLTYRYPDSNQHEEVLLRMERELNLIHKQGYESYFLINWDMLRFARERKFFYVGRGSGANSIVAYLLRITDVDPIKLDLYFERFINPHRENPPDFDIDFSWRDRDEVTAYLFNKYGDKGQIALLATYNTFSYRSLIRELGKVFGLPKAEMDRLAVERSTQQNPDDYVKLIYRYAGYMDGLPNYLSVHAGGIIISEKPVHYYSATEFPPKGYPIVQFDMVHAEDAGLYKFDVLSQRGLGKIKESVELVKQRGKEKDLDIHHTERFFADPKVAAMLRRGDAMGCFYIESPAMRMLLQKMEADTYIKLIAASSIIRPGVAKSGMMKAYIERSHDESERWRETTPEIMQELMAETYGVMVYQEDVIKVAHHFAGLSLGEADMLRRGMSGKFRSRKEFAKVREKFFENCKVKGYSDELTAEVWRQTESFAGYAFSKGHSASYAVESYQSLYLKAHYPMEFIVGVLNNGGGFYSVEMYFHEARMLGATIEAPCINNSNMLSVLVGEHTIYMGFYLVRDLEDRVVERFLNERLAHGAYTSLADFVDRCPISIEQLSILVRTGAFRFSGKNKQDLLWEVYHLLGSIKKSNATANLFRLEQKSYELPPLDQLLYEEAFEQIELFGFPLVSPFKLLKESPKNYLQSKDLKASIGRRVNVIGYLVTIKNTKASNGKLMQFGTFVDEAGGWIDTVHFPPVVSRYPFKGKAIYWIEGKVMEEHGYASIEVQTLKKMSFIERDEGLKVRRRIANQ